MAHGIKEALDIRIKHPIHRPAIDTGIQSIQRIMLAASRPESIRKPDEVFLIDCRENLSDGLLDNFILQAPDAQWSLRTVGLWDICPLGRPSPIAPFVHPVVQVLQVFVELFPVGLLRHAITSGSCIPLKRQIALLQKIDGDMMQQRGELHIFSPSRRSAHSQQSIRRGCPARRPDHGRLMAVSLGLRSSLHSLRQGRALFVRLLLWYYAFVRLLIRVRAHRLALPFLSRPELPLQERMRSPRFRTKDLTTCSGSPTAQGPPNTWPLTCWVMLSSASLNCIDTPECWFRSSIPGPWSPLSTLHVCPHGEPRMTRGRDGRLNLSRKRLSLPSLCQLFLAY